MCEYPKPYTHRSRNVRVKGVFRNTTAPLLSIRLWSVTVMSYRRSTKRSTKRTEGSVTTKSMSMYTTNSRVVAQPGGRIG